jgi:hypothetical protein
MHDLYQKDERAMPGNLQNSRYNFLPFPKCSLSLPPHFLFFSLLFSSLLFSSLLFSSLLFSSLLFSSLLFLRQFSFRRGDVLRDDVIYVFICDA